MDIFDCILIITLILMVLIILYIYKALNHICCYIDEILHGNLNQRIRLQTHISFISRLVVKINALAEKLQKVDVKNKLNEESHKKMISNISHDLRTPLTSILGYMELLMSDSKLQPFEKEKYMKIICDKGNYLYSTLEEFFQLSKIDSNDFKLDINKINICETARKNIISFFNELRSLNIEPELNFQEENIYMNSDEKSLNRIFSNLIGNSLKYAEKATKIGIDINYNENMIFISVWDNGIGIPEDEIDYIFDRLYTVEKSRNSNTKSSGIGLSIVKKLVKSLNGRIDLSSIPLKKTEFKITFKTK
ncbi:MAG: HAMP domain-containing histidine kinase [Clostridium luticellarii]|uniref:histidine kinase n=1 Tax=Clostridium luticellarii TaxID=1691940 RepID=A0A2T0BMA9_9CLOT|nr:HAMP domain-containing sensor histidine kinase [Clostridium luticellarii]MCI2040698.1 HAMP domain-containing histidine kinase [Clostridium luticellarii]PRR84932.1 Sensor histidine kinase YycG [Clostridium luticellarii]